MTKICVKVFSFVTNNDKNWFLSYKYEQATNFDLPNMSLTLPDLGGGGVELTAEGFSLLTFDRDKILK